ncbi:hypothetical protein RhiirC2_707879, partial [Rhizophagus irregularis]
MSSKAFGITSLRIAMHVMQLISNFPYSPLMNLDSTWGVLCSEHCLRICPATFSPDQHAERRTYVALLASLPRGTIVFFTDHYAYSSSLDGPASTFFHANGSSRLDYIWSSPGFPAPGLFSQVVTCPYLLDRPFTDHKVLITVFDFSTCLAILAKSRLKQKKEMRTVFSYTSTSNDQWMNFTNEVDDSLGGYLNKQNITRSDFLSLSLDLSGFLSTKFAQHLTDSVEYYTALRDEHFSDSLGTFIDSALLVEKRSIVFDRVLVVLDSTPTLLTDPSDIKQAAVAHFQTVVSPPLVHYHSIASFPPRWQKAYTPLPDVSVSLYDPVLAPITLQEWSDVISSMPNNKASGPSKISYEMLKHLSGDALDFSLLLANTCLSH